MPALDVDGLVSVFKAAPPNAVILVVTHSDRLPILAGRSGANTTSLTSSITLRFGEILE